MIGSIKKRGVLAMTAAVALLALAAGHAWADGWFWNARLAIEGVETATVWSVSDDPDGADDYTAQLRVAVPRGADARLVSRLTESEHVHIAESKDLSCTAEGVEVVAEARVVPVGHADGSRVAFRLVAAGRVLAAADGAVREAIAVSALLPTPDGPPACWTGDDEA